MKQITRVAILLLFTLIVAPAQQDADNRGPDRFAASVSKLAGACYVRDNKSAKPRRLKSGDGLQAGQELQCEAKARLKILFRRSGNEKEISATDPNWYLIPNVPGSVSRESGPRLAGRAKGNDPPDVAATASAGSSVSVSSRSRTVLQGQSGELGDGDLFWKSREKYFLIVAATKTAGANTDLPFTKVDAQRVSRTLTEVGYKKLELLTDELATHDNFVTQLQKIRGLPSNAMVIVYYSGHAVTDPQGKDLWLQLYGQKQFGDHFGLSVSGLVDSARGATYRGDLAIILDSCYSGRGALTSQLSLRETENTVIFASSAYHQPSYSKQLPSGIEMSAFTYYLLEGLGVDWAQVDGDADGIILYSDLQIYVGNRLLEQLQGGGLIGPMQPQLLAQSPKIWAAYDAKKALNFETQQLKNLQLERAFRVQNPETLAEMLPSPLPPGSHSYFRALKALKEKEFDEAWKRFADAEKERRVPLAEIYWARAVLKFRQGELGASRDWYEKALAASPEDNVDLIEQTANSNFGLGSWARAGELYKRVIDLLGGENEEKPEMIDSLAFLAMLSTVSGNTIEGELYLGRLRRFDTKVLEAHEEGLSHAIPFLDFLLDVLRGRKESARRKLAQLQKNLPAMKGDALEALRPLLQSADEALNKRESDQTAHALKEVLTQWEEALQQRKVSNIVLLLNQLKVIASGSEDVDFLRTVEVEGRLKRTVELAQQHKSERRKVTLDGLEKREVEVEGSEEQSALESALLLSRTATIYAARGDVLEAEKLYKQAISLDGENAKRATSLSSRMSLAELYEDSGRVNDAEKEYSKALSQLPGGDQSFDAQRIQEQLGRLYEGEERWKEAEQKYRIVARLAQSGFGADSVLAIDAQETLAAFLFRRGRDAETITLLEPVVNWFERRRASDVWLVERYSFEKDYLRLAKSYYQMKQYDAAETAFHKASELTSAREDADLFSKSESLVWQWFVANALKKSESANRLYQELVRLIRLELAKPDPDKSVGADLDDFAAWFRDGEEYAKAEELLRLALDLQKKVYGPDKSETAYIWESFGELDGARGRYKNALVSFKTAQTIYERQSPAPANDLSNLYFKIGYANYAHLDFEEARLNLTRSVELLPSGPESRSFSRYYLGRVERFLGHLEASKRVLKADLDEEEKASNFEPSVLCATLLELVSISRVQGDRADANQWLARAQKTAEGIDPVELKTYWSRFDYERGMLALEQGKTKEAAELLRVAVEKVEKNTQMDQALLLEYLGDYAKVMRKRGKNKEAVLIEQRAKEVRENRMNDR